MPRAKGRLLPSSLSRSAAFAGLPMRAKVLYPLMMANADDQGRVAAEAQMMKWEVCPNVQEISVDDIPDLLVAMQDQGLIRVFDGGGMRAAQLLLWWTDQASMQWAYPSDFVPPDGWNDRLRFRQSGQVITINWPNKADGTSTTPLAELAPQLSLAKSLGIALGKALGKPLAEDPMGNPSGNALAKAPLPEATRGRGGVRVTEEEHSVTSAEVTGSSEHPSPSASSTVPSPPHTYREWITLLEEATNGREVIGTLADFARTQYPQDAQGDTAGPSMRQLASNIGGILQTHNLDAADLFKIMWRATANLPEGDFLAYVRSAAKRQEEGYGRDREQRAAAGADGGEEWPGFDVEDDGPAEPEKP